MKPSATSTLRGLRLIGVLLLLQLTHAQAQPYGLDTRPAVGAFLNGALPLANGSDTAWSAVEAFPNLAFNNAVGLVPQPGTNRLYVLEREGRIFSIPNITDTTNKTLVLDLSQHTQGYNDSGLLGLALHPQFGQPGSSNRNYIYVYYNYSPQPVGPEVGGNAPNTTQSYNRLSRFTVPDEAVTADPESELVLINQYDEHLWHNGGGIFFGLDGFLYLSNGDEGTGNDSLDNTQTITNGLFAGVLRIDVDMDSSRSHPIRRQPQNGNTTGNMPVGWPDSFTANYFIPNDNPWVNTNGSVLEEFYAIGLRSPHRMTYDPPSGRIWVGDVGEGAWEEVSLIEKGGNSQWAYQEGANSGPKTKPGSLIGTDQPPVYDYPHANNNNCVIGGYVYRGSAHPSLSGQYIFGDNGSGRVWKMSYDGIHPTTVTLLCTVPDGIYSLTSFGLDQSNELYMCVYGEGKGIYKLAATANQTTPPPALLSQTGIFTNTASLTPADVLVPFDVASPLWSDGAHTQRWLAVPNDGAPYSTDETISFATNGNWNWPIGSVLVKHFDLPINDTNPTVSKRLETRLLVHGTNQQWYGLTYKWRADGSDADLLSDGLAENILITTATGVRTQIWNYPSRDECRVCHNANAGGVLGPRTCQLNHTFYYPQTSVADNQLRALGHAGYFDNAPAEVTLDSLPQAFPLDHPSAPLATKVRSYLDSNCAHCHRPNGVRADFDARFDTPLEAQNIVGGLVRNTLGVTNARVVMPQSVTQSIMHFRQATALPALRMPPLGRTLVDTAALNILTQWIASLPPIFSLPSPWTNHDVGPVGIVGSAAHALGKFTLTGSGVDIWDPEDSFHFMYRPLVGDATLTVRVGSQQRTASWALAGVMLRQSLDAASQHAFVGCTPDWGISFTRRLIPDGFSSYTAGDAYVAPYWVRLTRRDNTFTAYQSADGTNWTQVGSPQAISMTGSIYAGLAVTSADNSVLGTATFDHLLLTGPNVNNPPSISEFASIALDENTTSSPVNFQVSDIETAASNLVVTAISSNPALIDAGLIIGGGGTNRTLTLTPVVGQSGITTITVAVTDAGGLGASNSFQLTVNALAPSGISGIVRDAVTLLPIPGARVTLQATAHQTNTEADGHFTLLINNGTDLVIVGAQQGYYNASVTTNAPATNVNLWLEPVPLMQNSNYVVLSPNTCGVCHPNQLAQWQGTPMASAGSNTWVHDTYSGLGTANGTNGFVYLRDSVLAPNNPNAECAACHQPQRWIHTPFTPLQDLTLTADAATVHGVSCEVCHKIANVDTNKINFPGIFPGAVEFSRPTDSAHQVQYGVLGDTDYTSAGLMRPAFQPQLVAQVCAVCHQDANDPDENHTYTGPISEPTYLEWLNSDYSNPLSSNYASCVTCHMPPSGVTQVSSILPLTRSTNSIRSHTIVGTTPEFLENAVELQLAVTLNGNVLQVQVTVTNAHAGHHVPTGVTVRNVILLVEAWRDSDHLPLTHTGTQTVHALGGVGDPAQGYYAGQPGKLYAFVNRDALGNSPVFFTEADSVLFDSRLAANTADTTSYSFAVPPEGGPLRVRARLIYRRAWRAIVDAKQWTQTGHGLPLEDIQPPHFGHLMEMAEAALAAPTNQPPTANADSMIRFATQGTLIPVANLLTNDTDPDGDELSLSAVMDAQPIGASLSLSNSSISYWPAFGDTNPGSFHYAIHDSRGNGATGLVSVLVQPDPPVADILTLVTPAGGAASGALAGYPGFTYTVQYTDTLNPPMWQKLIVLIADDAGHLEFTDNLPPGQEKRFYRAVRGAMP